MAGRDKDRASVERGVVREGWGGDGLAATALLSVAKSPGRLQWYKTLLVGGGTELSLQAEIIATFWVCLASPLVVGPLH